MTRPLHDKVVLITGAGSGIGRATAVACAEAGAKVVVTDVDEEGGAETLRLVEEIGEGIFAPMDVTDRAQIGAAVKKTVDAYGRLDCAYNNAGWEGPTSLLHEYTDEDWDRLMDINLKGVWHCMQEELKVMEKGASVVNCSSVAGLVGFQGSSGYVASKHGVIGLTRTGALEGAPQGIRVNAVCPGAIRTPMIDRAVEKNPALGEGLVAMHPLGRIGEPEEIADAVVWLFSERSSFVTGQAIAVDGGWTMH